jgi:hypothetical protein
MSKMKKLLSGITRSLSIPSRREIDRLAFQVHLQALMIDKIKSRIQHSPEYKNKPVGMAPCP